MVFNILIVCRTIILNIFIIVIIGCPVFNCMIYCSILWASGNYCGWLDLVIPLAHPAIGFKNLSAHTAYNHTYIKFLSGQHKTISHLNRDKTTLFTRDPAEYKSNLDLKINNTAVCMATHLKVLGLTIDIKLIYSTHIHNISVQAHKPLQMIKGTHSNRMG